MENKKEFLWSNRDRDLANEGRYGKFDIVYYRTNLHMHYVVLERMFELFEPYLLAVYPNLNTKKAKLIIRHHDDFELLIGDLSLQAKLNFNARENFEHEQEEIAAIEKLSKMYPKKVDGYVYKDLLLSAVYKTELEAQIHSFLDKIYGYCEAIHEILAGNVVFLEPIINYHTKTFYYRYESYPLLKELFDKSNIKHHEHPLFGFGVVDLKGFFKNGSIAPRLHAKETLLERTGISHYEIWKKIVIEKFGHDALMIQKEFYNTQT